MYGMRVGDSEVFFPVICDHYRYPLALGEVREQYRLHKRVKVKVTAGKRSLPQNDISHAWYEQMALEDRQEDARGHRRYCKLHHGVPIRREEIRVEEVPISRARTLATLRMYPVPLTASSSPSRLTLASTYRAAR